MKTSVRFDHAIHKLYTAFHNKTLNPDDCKQCAVGNIMDNKDSWKHLTDSHGSTKLNYVGLVHQNLGRRFNGYSPIEVLQIESAFLKGCGYHFTAQQRLFKPESVNDTKLFNGLSAVVSQLCRFDGIDDVMDCSILFEFDDSTSELELV
ncbi:Na(+)-translocating NADH-quinone reductase subunit F [Winogradskyella forsetii]|uniref:Na(+)-translocating NADH-quinone reductase subunit F n=1 Tax=Winogradskyella forsetii TaxID=2686077 RepID=UPI0015C00CDC|nr:Na(+)-translocating NADH-quinone reductase subunit F [Winogradskyella forsetii]